MDEPMSLHLVLTGPGGGTWDVPIGTGGAGAAGASGTRRRGDRVRRGRLLPAGRQPGDPAGLDLHITGDAERAAAVLAAAPVLALD